MRQGGRFYKWCITHQGTPCKVSCCFRTGSCSPAPLMVTGQPFLKNWKIRPSISVRMKISLISWIVSTETDPKAGGESPPGTSPWFLHQLTKVHFEPVKEASLKHLTFKTVFLLAWGRASVEVGYMLGKTEILDTNSTGQRCPCTHYPVSLEESAGQTGSRQCGPSGHNSPAPNSG